MIPPGELRLNSLVLFEDNQYVVTGFGQFGDEADVDLRPLDPDLEEESENASDLEPVPLDAEFLKEIGHPVRTQETLVGWEQGTFEIVQDFGGFYGAVMQANGVPLRVTKELKAVHQLQGAWYFIAGQELMDFD